MFASTSIPELHVTHVMSFQRNKEREAKQLKLARIACMIFKGVKGLCLSAKVFESVPGLTMIVIIVIKSLQPTRPLFLRRAVDRRLSSDQRRTEHPE